MFELRNIETSNKQCGELKKLLSYSIDVDCSYRADKVKAVREVSSYIVEREWEGKDGKRGDRNDITVVRKSGKL